MILYKNIPMFNNIIILNKNYVPLKNSRKHHKHFNFAPRRSEQCNEEK